MFHLSLSLPFILLYFCLPSALIRRQCWSSLCMCCCWTKEIGRVIAACVREEKLCLFFKVTHCFEHHIQSGRGSFFPVRVPCTSTFNIFWVILRKKSDSNIIFFGFQLKDTILINCGISFLSFFFNFLLAHKHPDDDGCCSSPVVDNKWIKQTP